MHMFALLLHAYTFIFVLHMDVFSL